MNDEQFEEFVKGLDDNIEEATTCLATTPGQPKEHGLVLTVKGVDVVLLQSDLEEIIAHLDSLFILEDN